MVSKLPIIWKQTVADCTKQQRDGMRRRSNGTQRSKETGVDKGRVPAVDHVGHILLLQWHLPIPVNQPLVRKRNDGRQIDRRRTIGPSRHIVGNAAIKM